MVAELLGLPCVTRSLISRSSGGTLEAEREIEGGIEVVTCALPAVLTCDKGLNTPGSPRSRGSWPPRRSRSRSSRCPWARRRSLRWRSPCRRSGSRAQIVGEGADAVPALVRLLREEAKVI